MRLVLWVILRQPYASRRHLGFGERHPQPSDTTGCSVGRGAIVRAGSSGTKTIGGTNTSGTVTYSGNVALADNLTLSAASGGTVLFSGVISGSGFGITKSGNGIVTLTGANSYTGPTTVSAGTLATGAAEVIPDASAMILASGAILSLGGSGNSRIDRWCRKYCIGRQYSYRRRKPRPRFLQALSPATTTPWSAGISGRCCRAIIRRGRSSFTLNAGTLGLDPGSRTGMCLETVLSP